MSVNSLLNIWHTTVANLYCVAVKYLVQGLFHATIAICLMLPWVAMTGQKFAN